MGITRVRSLLVEALDAPATEREPTELGPTDVEILEATIRCVSRYGLQRMTVTDVAAEAGVGRATVFRHFTSKEELVRRSFAWELGRIVDRFHVAMEAIADPREQAVEWIVQAVQVVRNHPVARRLVADAAALPVMHDDRITGMLLDSVGHELDLIAQRTGTEFDTETAAELLLRFFTSAWLTPDLGTATATEAGTRRLARTMLAFLAVRQEEGSTATPGS